MRLSSVGDRLVFGSYRLHSRFARAANYEAGGKLLCTVSDDAGPGPLNLVFSDFDEKLLGPVLDFSSAGASTGGLLFTLDGAPRYDSELLPPQAQASRAEHEAAAFLKILLQKAPELSFAHALAEPTEPAAGFAGELLRSARAGIALLESGRLYDAVRNLRGLGVGLTPSGDDFLCGFLLGINVLEKARGKNLNYLKQTVYGAALGRGILTDAFLACACEGRAGWRMKQLFDAMAGQAGVTRAGAVEIAIAHGATSGADLAAGFIFALHSGGRYDN